MPQSSGSAATDKMLSLKNVTKNYAIGDSDVQALKGISIDFRKSEFVSVLGPSGCGKTTLLNIIGGLDRYTDGDISVNGVSTKKYKESDWDNYRNHSIGFVFQSYNLIPHQSVLANVELALTLSGVSKSERRKRAAEVLKRVGLGDQMKKKPSQMSGGQMQRVAIARALVNDPEILLADEPTGALDSETSVQIMELLKEISKDKLIIMVTHNPDLAERYSSRIIKLLDGKIVGDSDPYSEDKEEKKAEPEPKKVKGKKKKASMSFLTAMSLSMNNLLTKKARTFLTSFAGSIGIIGIALILALSTGINAYIADIQEETLASYPLSITSETADLSSLLASFMSIQDDSSEHDNDAVYSSASMYKLMNTINSQTVTNDLKSFKVFLDNEMKEGSETALYDYVTAILCSYNVNINAYATAPDGSYVKSDIMSLFASYGGGSENQMAGMNTMSQGSFRLWEQLLAPSDGDALVSQLITDEYELLDGHWPESSDEVVLRLTHNNEVPDYILYALGLKSYDEMSQIMLAVMRGEQVSTEIQSWQYNEITGRTFKLILDSDYYRDLDGDGIYQNVSNDSALMDKVIGSGRTLKISGIIRAKEDAKFAILNGAVGYTEALSKEIINAILESDVVKAQKENPDYDVITGLPFYLDTNIPDSEKKQNFLEYCSALTDAQRRALYAKMLSSLTDEEIEQMADDYISGFGSREELIDSIILQYSEPLGIDFDTFKQMYGSTFEAFTDAEIRDAIISYIKESNDSDEALNEILSTPTEEELQGIINTSLAMIKQMMQPQEIDDAAAKQMIIVQAYSQLTSMSPEFIMQYLATLTPDQTDEIVRSIAAAQYASTPLTEEQQNAKISASFAEYLNSLSDDELIAAYDRFTEISDSAYDTNLDLLGVADPDEPSMINIYTASFASKDKIADIIAGYNKSVDEDHEITYTDYVALIMSSVTDIINAISYVLIAFVSISLVVSSIMIGIITYISVLERTKEIGILRSIGASKRDISRVFNAETLIVGFAAGMIGIIFTVLVCLPINAILHAVTGIPEINAALPVLGGVVLVLISMALTLIAGLIPSRLAAKKDPVVALRTE